MNDWVEFKRQRLGERQSSFLLRPEYIVALDGKEGKDMTEIQYDTGSDQLTYYASEPYEQVKQKVMDAEKVDLSNVVVEHFTRGEYEVLEFCLTKYVESLDTIEMMEKYARLQNKLNEILKEEE